MSDEFIGARIEVRTDLEEPTPLSFTWEGREYGIIRIIRTWHDHGFSQAAPARNWRSRRHRNVFLVQVASGEVYEIYLDRGSGRRDWYIYRQVKQ